jgi:hypothetical protein
MSTNMRNTIEDLPCTNRELGDCLLSKSVNLSKFGLHLLFIVRQSGRLMEKKTCELESETCK